MINSIGRVGSLRTSWLLVQIHYHLLLSMFRKLILIYLSVITFLSLYYGISYIFVWFEILKLEKVELMSLYNDTIKGNEIILQKLALVDISSIYHQVCFSVFKHTYDLDYDIAIFVYKYKLLTEAQLLEIQQLIDLRDHMFVKNQLHQELQKKKEEQRLRLLSIIYLGYHITLTIRTLFGGSSSRDGGSSAQDTNPETEITFHPFGDFNTLFSHNDDSIPNNNKSLSDNSTVRVNNDGTHLNDDDSLESLEPFKSDDDSLESLEPFKSDDDSLESLESFKSDDDSLESLEPFEWWS